mgnify:CR=1 FL=1
MIDLIHALLHLDQVLILWTQWMGPWVYLALAFVFFAETGLVVTPFLPGDSLLFAVGAMTSLEGNVLQLHLLIPLLMFAVFLGDNVNYFLGLKLGPKLFSNPKSKIFNHKHLQKTHQFYERHGGRAIILGRFIPIVRTFVPFVAGIGSMQYSRFILMSLLGAICWIPPFLLAGHYFGNLPAIQKHFHLVILAVIAISLAPLVIEIIKSRRK